MAEALSNKTFQLELVAPERVVASEPVSMVIVPGEEGDFGVLADHAPFLSSLRPGVVSVTTPMGVVNKIFVSGGFADVGPNICSLLVEEAVNVSDLDRTALEQSLKALESDLLNVGEDAAKKNRLIYDIDVTRAKISAT